MERYSDVELIILVKQDNSDAFNELYSRYWKELYRLAYCSISSEDDAKDMVQNVFINLWKLRHKIDPEKFHKAYIFTSLKNNIINFYRKDLLRKRSQEEVQSDSHTFSNEDIYLAKELSGRINTEIDKLPQKMREVFTLSRHKNLSVLEISEHLKITPRTVKNQLSNALKILRTRLE